MYLIFKRAGSEEDALLAGHPGELGNDIALAVHLPRHVELLEKSGLLEF